MQEVGYGRDVSSSASSYHYAYGTGSRNHYAYGTGSRSHYDYGTGPRSHDDHPACSSGHHHNSTCGHYDIDDRSVRSSDHNYDTAVYP